MIRFPIHAPTVEVEPLSGEPTAVQRRDLWGLLPEVKAENVTGYYYRYRDSGSPPLYFSRRRVSARLTEGETECIEVQNETWNPGDTERPDFRDSTLYFALSPTGYRTLRSIYRNKNGTGSMRAVTEPEEPWRLTVGQQGGRRERPGTGWEITGAVRVRIEGREYRCLRQLNRFVNGPVLHITETYFTENGRTLLTRGYESEGGEQFDYLEERSEIRSDGVTYRLLCDMIPDGSLVDGPPPRPEPPVPYLTRFGRM